ncbi:MAG: iron ABC transporter permease [Gammaproteobacteria bacterium]|nr:iron ABC transporter permease [Gammaproteobacteria bacterium]
MSTVADRAGSRRPAPALLLLLAVCALLFVAALCVGPVPTAPLALPRLLWGDPGDPLSVIVRELRLPRALLAVLVGASLGLSGAALQGLLRNPLAEPGLLGISGCAALCAVLVFYSGLAGHDAWVLPAAGMVGAGGAVLGLYALAGRQASMLTLILAGVALNSLAAALTTLVLNLTPNPFAAYEIFFWLMGSLANRSFEHLWLILPFVTLGAALLLASARGLDALALGEDVAHSLGTDLGALRRRVILGSALAVGSSVAVTGVIGFVGLVVPHLVRPLVGHRPGAVLVLSAVAGAALTLAADLGTRFPLLNGELRLGVVTALLGAPFFIHLVLRSRLPT